MVHVFCPKVSLFFKFQRWEVWVMYTRKCSTVYISKEIPLLYRVQDSETLYHLPSSGLIRNIWWNEHWNITKKLRSHCIHVQNKQWEWVVSHNKVVVVQLFVISSFHLLSIMLILEWREKIFARGKKSDAYHSGFKGSKLLYGGYLLTMGLDGFKDRKKMNLIYFIDVWHYH